MSFGTVELATVLTSFAPSLMMPPRSAQLLEALNAYPVTIIAHSLGGAISLLYAGAFPERIAQTPAR